jgi:hypothetical protein
VPREIREGGETDRALNPEGETGIEPSRLI